MANPFPFVAGDVLTAAEMNGIGEAAVSWTPTYTGFTLGNGTVVAKYVRVNKLIFGYFFLTLGSTSVITGTVQISSPVTLNSSQVNQLSGSVIYFDASVGAAFVGPTVISGTGFLQPNIDATSGTFATRAVINAASPAVFATGDQIYMTFTCEAA